MRKTWVYGICSLGVLWTLATASSVSALERVRERERAAAADPALDLDKDGKLDHGEWKKAVDAEIGSLDTDKDGKLDHGERKAVLQKFKATLDMDKDGKLDHGELRKALGEMKESHPELYEHLMRRLRERRERRKEG